MDQWLERYRGLLFVVLVVLIISGVVLVQWYRSRPAPILLSTAVPSPSPEATPTPRPVRVYVSGAVRQPDVYELAAGSIVKDAVQAAGGATHEADLDRINLAAAVADGQHVYVPQQGERDLPVEPPANQAAGEARVNINTADTATLETLPGIGPSLAQRIVEYRQANGPFATAQDIMAVSGIGSGVFAKIEELITTD